MPFVGIINYGDMTCVGLIKSSCCGFVFFFYKLLALSLPALWDENCFGEQCLQSLAIRNLNNNNLA